MAAPIETSLQAFLFTDIVGSTDLKHRLGDIEGARVIVAHDDCFRECVARFDGVEQNNPGDGFFATFKVPSAALKCALAFQAGLTELPLQARVGIHLGESVTVSGAGDDKKLLGLAVDTAGRVMSLAMPGQILITRHAFDSARQQVMRGLGDEPIVWRAHGAYHLKGLDEPIEVHEAGIEGTAPLSPPPDSEKARRAIAPGDEETLGWRPGAGLGIPGRDGWRLDRKLGAGGFGEVWLATSPRTKQRRAFKFCFRADRLRSLKRELTLFSLLKETLGERDDIARLYDVSLEESPYFLEMEFTPDGSLDQWAVEEGRIERMAIDERAEFVAGIAEALRAAHSVGVIHKDVKPSNVLVRMDAENHPRPRLTDFGIGQMLDTTMLAAAQVSATGFTDSEWMTDLGSRTGTRLYMAPELLAGGAASIASDVYALGVLLYQMIVGDLSRPMALGWERFIPDPLLVEDIAACVAGEPEERPASCGIVAERLRSLEARRLRQAEDERRRAAEVRRARLLRITAIAAVVLLVSAIVGFAMAGALDKRRREAEEAREQTALERDAKARALEQVLRLADSKRVRDLAGETSELWPVHPDRAPLMASWLARTQAVLQNRAGHEEALAELRSRAEPPSEERASWSFASHENDWRHQVLGDLLAGLGELEVAHGKVTERHEAATTRRQRSIDAYEVDWGDTIQAIAVSPKYAGLALVPQLGLIPLGMDPDSGLFEFAHLGSGEIPTRDQETGHLVLSDDFSVVLVLIPAGTFLMGAQGTDPSAPNHDPLAGRFEGPVHEVHLSAYFLSKYECTQAQWARLADGDRPSQYVPDHPFFPTTLRHPVEQVTWGDCALWLPRHGLTLPTEAQWEHACRAGEQTPWFIGREPERLSRAANIADAFLQANGGGEAWAYTEEVNDGHAVTAPVGSLDPNAFGLHEVHGNVWEWCMDAPVGYSAEPVTDPLVRLDGDRVLRGGSWNRIASFARSSAREALTPTFRGSNLGVRPARPVAVD